MKIRKSWTRVVAVCVGLVGLAMLSFNCGMKKFEANKGMQESSASVVAGNFDKPVSPYSLLISDQVFNSMLNVTGQAGASTSAQRAEYELRKGAMADNDSLALVNGPLMIATTSLAGEICNGLVNKERALAAADRTFFAQVDFSKPVAQNSPDAFLAAADLMAQDFYSRKLTPNEIDLFQDFYGALVKTIPSNAVNSNQQTSNLYLSLCAAMLSSFDSIVY